MLALVYKYLRIPVFAHLYTFVSVGLSFNLIEDLAGWLPGWLVGWLGGWVVGWLGGWLAGWLLGWFLKSCLLIEIARYTCSDTEAATKK